MFPHELASELRVLAHDLEALETRARHLRSVLTPVTKEDLKAFEKVILMKVEDAIAALNQLSTASDSASIKIDALVADVNRLILAFTAAGTGDLTQEQEAAVANAKKSSDAAAAAGDKVDASVAAIDAKLPQPAPPGA